jgi:hypothetical protein
MTKKLTDYYEFDSLGHQFQQIDDLYNFDIEFTKCSICKFRVWLGEEEFWYFVNYSWKKLDMSCEEVQIKNLLE